MPNLGMGEIILILAVLLLLFGARKLPELARSLGKSTKEFKAGMRDGATNESEPSETTAQTTTPEQTKTPE
jgi:sec-independent protein translocase protein TatA